MDIGCNNADRLTELIRDVPVGTDTTWRYWYDQAGNRTFDDTIKPPGGPDVRTRTLNLLDQVATCRESKTDVDNNTADMFEEFL